MSDQVQEQFEAALADVFEGREFQFGHGPRKLLREFYDRARTDAGARPRQNTSKIGQSVVKFSDLQPGDVFQNAHLSGMNRCRRVTRVIDSDTIETEYVSTRSKRVVQTEEYDRHTFEGYWNYSYIADPG